jgi:hypothetical protein
MALLVQVRVLDRHRAKRRAQRTEIRFTVGPFTDPTLATVCKAAIIDVVTHEVRQDLLVEATVDEADSPAHNLIPPTIAPHTLLAAFLKRRVPASPIRRQKFVA